MFMASMVSNWGGMPGGADGLLHDDVHEFAVPRRMVKAWMERGAAGSVADDKSRPPENAPRWSLMAFHAFHALSPPRFRRGSVNRL